MFLRNQFKGVGMFHLPLVKKQPIQLDSIALIGYDKLSEGETEKIVHFFLDDNKFGSIYNATDEKIETLKRFKAVLTPDFSMYTEMPTALQLYNCFRNRWVGAYLQSKGVKVIPTVRWGDLESFNYCFDGVEKGSIVAVSTIGLKGDKANFMLGYNEMIHRIRPEAVICYGKPFDEMKGRIIEVDYAETNHLSKGYVKTVFGRVESIVTIKGGGSAIETPKHSLPTKGKPNSKQVRYKEGKKIQERYYDENGDPNYDIDYTNHGNPKEHPNTPHKHRWENGKRGKEDELL